MANPEHIAKLNEGVEAWNEWRKGNWVRPDLSGADLQDRDFSGLAPVDLNHADLRKVDLLDAKVRGGILYAADLRDGNLERADLSGADLSVANLCGASLVEADLSKARLYCASMCEANLFGANFYQADLVGADVRGARFLRTNIADANIFKMQYLDPAETPFGMKAPPLASEHALSLWQRLRTQGFYRRSVMRGHFQGIRGLSSCYGNRVFVRDAADQDYLDTIKTQLHSRLGRLFFFWWGLIDYGRSLLSVIVFASIFILGFGCIYAHYPGMLNYGERCATAFTPYYFSIVTYTTLGFGDVKPDSLAGEILVSAEVILGYVTLGLLLAVLSEKIARRS